jgi:hypothetical protein
LGVYRTCSVSGIYAAKRALSRSCGNAGPWFQFSRPGQTWRWNCHPLDHLIPEPAHICRHDPGSPERTRVVGRLCEPLFALSCRCVGCLGERHPSGPAACWDSGSLPCPGRSANSRGRCDNPSALVQVPRFKVGVRLRGPGTGCGTFGGGSRSSVPPVCPPQRRLLCPDGRELHRSVRFLFLGAVLDEEMTDAWDRFEGSCGPTPDRTGNVLGMG